MKLKRALAKQKLKKLHPPLFWIDLNEKRQDIARLLLINQRLVIIM